MTGGGRRFGAKGGKRERADWDPGRPSRPTLCCTFHGFHANGEPALCTRHLIGPRLLLSTSSRTPSAHQARQSRHSLVGVVPHRNRRARLVLPRRRAPSSPRARTWCACEDCIGFGSAAGHLERSNPQPCEVQRGRFDSQVVQEGAATQPDDEQPGRLRLAAASLARARYIAVPALPSSLHPSLSLYLSRRGSALHPVADDGG
jgi:hypothetical protein